VEAERIGLINRMVPDVDLSDVVIDIARTIADNAPLSVAASKVSVANAVKDAGERDMEQMKQMSAACFDSADYREGRTAFMEKRSPKFQGR
jgi:enoyl-CoA hydratase/carnithine racemase